ncbi:MAG: cyclase family protein [Candidatus Aegiribacteria sp.]|nr:cyclase family protein [Candidatus Aegiribacteria sp.]
MKNVYSLAPDKMIDITRPLSENTPFWPGDEQFNRKLITVADGFVTSRLKMSSHSGTHMDAPAHLAHCDITVDNIPLTKLILKATVVDCISKKVIGVNVLSGLSLQGKALLLKTASSVSNHTEDFMNYPSLTVSAAETAREMGIALLGIDSVSVDPPESSNAHRIFLEASIPIVENLMLNEIDPGEYLLICLPLRIESGDGSPVRALLQPVIPADLL